MGEDYKILTEKTADIYGKVVISKLTGALEKQNCELISVKERDESLESYYVNLIGGGKNA